MSKYIELNQGVVDQFPNRQAQHAQEKGRDVLQTLKEYTRHVFLNLCFWSDNIAVHLASAAQMCSSIWGCLSLYWLSVICQQDSISPMLLALVNIGFDGPSIMDQIENLTAASISIVQRLRFNSIRHKCTQGTTKSSRERHSTSHETPVPIYIGLVICVHTCD